MFHNEKVFLYFLIEAQHILSLSSVEPSNMF